MPMCQQHNPTSTGVAVSRGHRLRFFVPLILSLLCILPGCSRERLSDAQLEEKKTDALITELRGQGTVEPKSYPPAGNGYVVDLKGVQLTDHTFQVLNELQRVAELDLSNSSLTDDQMDKLNELAPRLLKLDLSNTKVTDAGLEKLTKLKFCMNLKLTGTGVTPAAAERFKQEHKRNPKARVKIPELQIQL
jgi:hypothetical protein